MTADYVLSALRNGVLRARLIANEGLSIGIALKSGFVSPEAALLWARDAGVLEFAGQDDIEITAAEETTEAAA